MIETFSAMPVMLKVYWICAVAASIFFIIQAIAVFMGFDSDSDFDGGGEDFDLDGFHLISVKSLTSFVLGFGWAGVLFWDDFSGIALSAISIGVGLVFMLLIAFLMFQIMKLNRDNTFHTTATVGKIAEVYLRIPAHKKSSGKVVVSVNGSMHELEALTNEANDIPTGGKVRIVEAVDEDTVIVEAI